jgi:endonuclease I
MKNCFKIIVLCLIGFFSLQVVAQSADFGDDFQRLPPADYYSTANGLEKAALKTALFNIISSGTVERSYGQLWTDFQKTDKKENGNVWDMYSNCNFTFGSNQCGNYSAECACYNREHSFPKSWFGGEVMPMYTDLFHLYPTDGWVNNKRGNFPFGQVGTATYTSQAGAKLGANNFGSYSGTVFEPQNEYKGDFARTVFYMVTRYQNLLASWNNNNVEARPVLDGTTFPALDIWQLELLYMWHEQDPVSEKEINRNDSVYVIQHNRNPYIDHPEWVFAIWQDYLNGSSSITITEQTDNGISLYPNPVSTTLFISATQKSPLGDLGVVEIYDISGKLQLSTTLHNLAQFSTKTIDVSQLNSGTYFIKINDNFIKFVKN